MFSSLDAFEQFWELNGKITYQMKQYDHDALSPRHWLNLSGCVDSAGLVTSCATMSSSSMKSCSRADSRKRGRHRTLVADLADDVNHVCNFAGRDSSLLDNKNEFNKACSSFVEQAGDLGCFKCPSCAKAYISSTWFRRHLGRCPQPTGASTG